VFVSEDFSQIAKDNTWEEKQLFDLYLIKNGLFRDYLGVVEGSLLVQKFLANDAIIVELSNLNFRDPKLLREDLPFVGSHLLLILPGDL